MQPKFQSPQEVIEENVSIVRRIAIEALQENNFKYLHDTLMAAMDAIEESVDEMEKHRQAEEAHRKTMEEVDKVLGR